MSYGKMDWYNFERGIEKEWLVTNGLGGYACSTIINANTRKYHGLLVASLNPPVERVLLVSKVDEKIEIDNLTYNLATNQTKVQVSEFGFIHQQRMETSPVPCFSYSFSDVFIKKSIFMVYGQNTTIITYKIKNGEKKAKLFLRPLVNCRDFHWTVQKGQIHFQYKILTRGIEIRSLDVRFWIKCDSGDCFLKNDYFYNMYYLREKERGENFLEDHFMPAEFVISLAPYEEKEVTLYLSAENFEENIPSGKVLLEQEVCRQKNLLQRATKVLGEFEQDYFLQKLILASDAFIVKRKSTNQKSIIAGYPWFNDWGRDAMIALPGLTLVTGRFNEAKEILLSFSTYLKDGLLPNTFADKPEEEPLYNTADASLWYFNAVYQYLKYTGDLAFVLEKIYPVLEEIINWHIKGTHYQIKMAEDGLLEAGSPEYQLTWMDAKIGRFVITPRHGKAIEICALWYNGLRIMEILSKEAKKEFPFVGLANKVKESFENSFWNEKEEYYYDVLSCEGKDISFRPNQVIAMALPFSPISEEKAKKVLPKVWQKLYATYGLRSLSGDNLNYKGIYDGDRFKRDEAYHQGTVWSFLMGFFVTAYRKAYGYQKEDQRQAKLFLKPFKEHLKTHGVNFISEIFDGDEPIKPRGAIAQAWGVAEVLRVYAEEVLEIRNWRWEAK